MDTDPDSLSVNRVASDPVVKRSLGWTEFRQMMRDSINQQTEKLNARVAQVTKDFLVGVIGYIDDDHNMLIV